MIYTWSDDSALYQYRTGEELTEERTWSAQQYLLARLEGLNEEEANQRANA